MAARVTSQRCLASFRTLRRYKGQLAGKDITLKEPLLHCSCNEGQVKIGRELRGYFKQRNRYGGKGQQEKTCEKPTLSTPSTEARENHSKYDWIGPPDPVSNIRRVHFRVPENEAPHERRLREERAKVQEWSHQFWKKHNTSFVQLKGEFIKQKLAEKSASRETTMANITLTPDEMSEFYKKFLDDNYQEHKNYNWEWYKKNISLTWLTLKVNLLNIITRRNKGNKLSYS